MGKALGVVRKKYRIWLASREHGLELRMIYDLETPWTNLHCRIQSEPDLPPLAGRRHSGRME